MDSDKIKKLRIMKKIILDKYRILKPNYDEMISFLNQDKIDKYIQIAKYLPGEERDKFTTELNRINKMKEEFLKDPRIKERELFENEYLSKMDSLSFEDINKMYNWITYINNVPLLYNQISTSRNNQLILLIYKEMLRRTRIKIDNTKILIDNILDEIEINETEYSKQMSDPKQMSETFQANANGIIKIYKDNAESKLLDLTVLNDSYDFLADKDSFNKIDKLFGILLDLNERMTNMNMYFEKGLTDVKTINQMASLIKSYPDEMFDADKRRDWDTIFTNMLNAFKADEEFEIE
jgi:hypothetical protein